MSNKHQSLTIESKWKICNLISKGTKQAKICIDFNLSKSIVATIWAKRSKLIEKCISKLDGTLPNTTTYQSKIIDFLSKYIYTYAYKSLYVHMYY